MERRQAWNGFWPAPDWMCRVAQREKAKGRRQVAGGPVQAPVQIGREAASDVRVVSPDGEIVRLKAELAAAKSRIVSLEAQRQQVVNRIDWVIDSLHNLVEEDR